MTQYLLYVTRGGSVTVQSFSSAFVRGLAVIALAHQPVVVTTADVEPRGGAMNFSPDMFQGPQQEPSMAWALVPILLAVIVAGVVLALR